jgi:hypothetical protein
MKRTKELMKQIILIALAIAMVITLIPVLNIGTCDVSEASASLYADDEYKVIEFSDGKVVKVGKYYFKRELDEKKNIYNVYISTNSKKGFKKTPISNANYTGTSMCTNGKQAYYVRGNGSSKFVLYKYVFSSRKETKIKKLPSSTSDNPVDNYSVVQVYGNVLAINGILDASPRLAYTYNLKTKKLSVLPVKNDYSNGFFVEAKNQYIIAKVWGGSVPNCVNDDECYYKTYLYKITSSGIEKVRDLSKRDGGYKIIGDKIIYIDINSKFTKTYIYQCNLDGSGKKQLAVTNGWCKAYYWASLEVTITSDYCILLNMDKFYAITDKEQKGYYVVCNFKTKESAALRESASSITPVGNKIYYAVNATLYKCNSDGSGKKKVVTFKTSKKNKSIWIDKIYPKYCIYVTSQKVQNGDKTKYVYTSYKYNYSTKKIKKIKSYTAAY